MLAGALAAAGIDLLAIVGDGTRPVLGLTVVMAGFVGGTGLLWLAEEIADGATCLREADGEAFAERAAETLHGRRIDPEPGRRLANAQSARTGVKDSLLQL
jgi:hypothetical protein